MDTYQDAYRPGAVTPGERDCDERWELIAPYIAERGVMVDVGSNLGYFGLRATSERPELAVVSIESDPLIAQRQATLIDDNDARRIVLLQGHLTASVCETWATTCDAVDTTLLLAIIHWLDDPARAVAALSSMSNRLILEVPHPDDSGACGQEKLGLWEDPIGWFGEVTGRTVTEIGRMRRHTSSTPSYVITVDGPVRRSPTVAYWGGPTTTTGERFRIEQDGDGTRLWVDGDRVDYRPGLNLVNLMRLGALRRPTVEAWTADFDAALAAAPGHQDPLPHNCIWTPGGLVLIDDEPRDALTTAADGRRALATNLGRWVTGDTVSGDVEIRTLTAFQRWRRSDAGRAVVDRIPAPVRRALRGAVRASLRVKATLTRRS